MPKLVSSVTTVSSPKRTLSLNRISLHTMNKTYCCFLLLFLPLLKHDPVLQFLRNLQCSSAIGLCLPLSIFIFSIIFFLQKALWLGCGSVVYTPPPPTHKHMYMHAHKDLLQSILDPIVTSNPTMHIGVVPLKFHIGVSILEMLKAIIRDRISYPKQIQTSCKKFVKINN